ncbi:MAG: response regulator [Firmicutes bacterium]|nr:response regulator [Bacillota bacterium]
MKTIYIVDDNDINLAIAEQVLEDSYRVLTLDSAARMFAMIAKITPDLILLDIEMPVMNGFDALAELKRNPLTASIPVIFLTASTDSEIEARGFAMGAVDFISKPFSVPVLRNRLMTHLNIDEMIKKRTMHIEQLKNGIISVIADIVEQRDKVTGGHIERTSAYLKILIDEMQKRGLYANEIKNWDINVVISSAKLHDVGKIKITDLILNKPGKLTPEEFSEMRLHTTEGEDIIGQIVAQTGEEDFLAHAKLFAGCHHERWDGKGYPRALVGAEIPLQGRIMAIVDVYDALISARPYKPAFSHEDAVSIIEKESGTAFDPALIDIFKDVKPLFAQTVKDAALDFIHL